MTAKYQTKQRREALQGIHRSANVPEDKLQQAWRARRAMYSLLPGLTSLANSVSKAFGGPDDLVVKIGNGPVIVDNKYIYLPPMMALGEERKHDRKVCSLRGPDDIMLCPACDALDQVSGSFFHEIAHAVAGSFDKAVDADRIDAIKRAMDEAEKMHPGSKRIETIRKRVEQAARMSGDYKTIAEQVSPWLRNVNQALEDARVNHFMYQSLEGTKHMFTGKAHRIARDGVEGEDGTVIRWNQVPLGSQMSLGILMLASDHERLLPFLDPEVEEACQDEKLRDLCKLAVSSKHVRDTFALSFQVLERCRELGFFLDPDDPEDDPPPQDSEPDDSDECDEGDDQDGDEGEGEQSDSSDAADEAPDEQGDADGAPADDEATDQEDSEGTGGDSDDTDDGDEESESDSGESGDDSESDEDQDGSTGSSQEDPDGDMSNAEQMQRGADADQAGDPAEGESTGDDSDGDEATFDVPADEYQLGQDSTASPGAHNEGDLGENVDPDDSGSDDQDDGDGELEMGDPDDAFEALMLFGEHSEPGEVERDDEDIEDVRAIELAMIQGEHFDSPSPKVLSFHLNKFNGPLRAGKAYDGWDRTNQFKGHFRHSVEQIMPSEAILGPSLLRLRRVFAENKKAKGKSSRSGRINAPRLASVRAGNKEVFLRTELPGKRDYAVVIMADNSGSTHSQDRIVIIKEMTMALGELMHRVGIKKFSMFAHEGQGVNDTLGYGTKYEQDVWELKAMNESWDRGVRERIAALSPADRNLDGHAMEFARKQLEAVTATDKIILYITDGRMPDANSEEEVPLLKRELQTLKRMGATVIGVGVHTESPKQHGLDTVVVSSHNDVGKVVAKLEEYLQ